MMDDHAKLERLIKKISVSSKDDTAALQSIFDIIKAAPLRDEKQKSCRSALAAFVTNAHHIKTRPNSYIFASGLLSGEFRDPRGLDALRTVFEFIQDPYQKSSVFWSIIRFASVNSIPFQKELARLYFQLLKSWSIPQLNLDDIPKFNFDSLVVVPQFLTPRHAPTADAIDYCKILRHAGFNPLILHTNELPDKLTLPLPDGFVANKRSDLSRIQHIEADGEKFPMFTPSGSMPSKEGLAIALAFVRAINPRFCIFAGAYSLLQEEIGAIAPSVILPTTVELAPSRTCISIMFSDLSEIDRDIIAAEVLAPEHIWDGYQYNYRLPPNVEERHERRDFGARDDSFVIALVGNRLPQEIDRELKELLLQISRDNPAIHILLVGPLEKSFKTQWQSEFGAATGFCDYAQNLPILYRQCDLYLNPKRSGGGTSAAFALAASLPVFTLRTGDVARIVPPSWAFESNTALRDAILALASRTNRTFEKDAAAITWTKISDRPALITGILKRMGHLPEELAHL